MAVKSCCPNCPKRMLHIRPKAKPSLTFGRMCNILSDECRPNPNRKWRKFGFTSHEILMGGGPELTNCPEHSSPEEHTPTPKRWRRLFSPAVR